MADNVTILKTIEVPTMSVSLRSDHLVQIVAEPGALITLPNVKAQIEAIGLLGNGKRFPVLILSGTDNSVPTEVMDFVAQKNSNPFAIAEGYLIGSISHKLLANFYLRFNKPARPTRFFTKEKEALQWLYSFL
jgi:hypothetical protein